MLRDRDWSFKYTADDGDLVGKFYVPALEDAERYDRLTGYFNAQALALAARGIEGLVRNNGRMRLVVGCTLEQPEIDAIVKGERLRDLVDRHLAKLRLAPPDPESEGALELLAWMVAQEILDVKVAVPCATDGTPIPSSGIFHEKTGIVEDRVGDRLAWTGSLNETGAGWQKNWESISVYTSWGPEPGRVEAEESSFSRIWTGQMQRVIVLDVPAAVRKDLMRFMPTSGKPSRLDGSLGNDPPEQEPPVAGTRKPDVKPPGLGAREELRSRVWQFIRDAPAFPDGGGQIGLATSAVDPWPHQVRAFERLYGNWPPKLLIADEVGLGKTIQAGMLLRQTWLARRAKRILIIAPKAVLWQWQIELREKFNLNWPVYYDGKLIWYPSPALHDRHECDASREDWHRQPAVIASSQLLRRADRESELLEQAEPWDLVVLDEAHHARRRGAGSQREGGPNTLLRLMRGLKNRAQGLVLLTATPMQVHPIEVWDLLDLLGLPPEWSERAFLGFFKDIEEANPSDEAMERMTSLFQSVERTFGKFEVGNAEQLTGLSRLGAKQLLRALRNDSSLPRRQLRGANRRAATKIMRASTPIRNLVSRNTRELLRRYFRAGKLKTSIAERQVDDLFLELTPGERAIYESVEDYISAVYGRASDKERAAVGFVMTIYRRRLASSFQALRETLSKHRDAIVAGGNTISFGLEEDLPDDEAADEIADADESAKLESDTLIFEQEAEINALLSAIGRLPPDSKLGRLREVLRELRLEGYQQAMVFTQYTDTMDFLREALVDDGEWRLLCFSGRGGEIPGTDGVWRTIGRDDAKRRFREGEADILLCTDAAAEGLNFQFCGTLVNYDMPWNPMRVEQRIGRIDRLGQKHKKIRIVNLHYEQTVETDIYRALRERIGLFESVVGRLQPILARLPSRISENVLAGENRDASKRAKILEEIEQQVDEYSSAGFDIDAVTESDLEMPELPPPVITMEDLDRIISSNDLMESDVEVRPLGYREYSFKAPGAKEPLRVTTDPDYFEEHTESVELWSPGNPLFVAPEISENTELDSLQKTLKDILDEGQ